MLYSYVKIALKVLLRRKFFTFISLFGISFTLMVLIVTSTMFENSIGSGGPETRLDRTLLVTVMKFSHSDTPNRGWSSSPGYKFLEQHIRNLPGVAMMSFHSNGDRVTAYPQGRKLKLNLKRTDGAYWQILEFDFVEGGPLSDLDEAEGRMKAVINESTRNRYFQADTAVGRTLEADGQRFEVVGVVRDVPIYRDMSFADIWVPISSAKSSSYRHEMMGGFGAILLTESADDFPTVKAALREELTRVAMPDPKRYNTASVFADTNLERIVRGARSWDEDPGVAAMLTKAGLIALLFMLLPAVNLININTSRIMERAAEIGVRKSFGATGRHLTLQFLTENLVITLLGGILGLAGAVWLLHLISNSGLIPYADFQINPNILAIGFGFTIFFGLFSGVYPAWRMSRLHPVAALKGGMS